MALTIAKDFKTPQKAQGEFLGILTGTITFDSSYPTGGESLSDLSDLFKDLYCVLTDSVGYVTSYDRTNDKLLAYYADYDGTADGALIEAASEADLSTLVVSFVAFGRI